MEDPLDPILLTLALVLAVVYFLPQIVSGTVNTVAGTGSGGKLISCTIGKGCSTS